MPAQPAAVLSGGAGLGEAGIDGELAVRRTLAVLARQHDPLFGGETRREGRIPVG